MCGNGIRCVAKYVYDYGLTDKTHISVETLGGIKYMDLTVEDGKVVLVRVDMGSPILTPAQIPVIADEAEAVAVPILVDETEYQMTCVSMGNPHAVIFMDDIEHLEIEKIGPKFEHHERFPNRVNTCHCHCTGSGSTGKCLPGSPLPDTHTCLFQSVGKILVHQKYGKRKR